MVLKILLSNYVIISRAGVAFLMVCDEKRDVVKDWWVQSDRTYPYILPCRISLLREGETPKCKSVRKR